MRLWASFLPIVIFVVFSWADLLLIHNSILKAKSVLEKSRKDSSICCSSTQSANPRRSFRKVYIFQHSGLSRIDYWCFSASNLFSKSRSPNLFLLRNNPQFSLARMHQFCSFEVWKLLIDICQSLRWFIRRISTTAASWSTRPGSVWTTRTPAVPWRPPTGINRDRDCVTVYWAPLSFPRPYLKYHRRSNGPIISAESEPR